MNTKKNFCESPESESDLHYEENWKKSQKKRSYIKMQVSK